MVQDHQHVVNKLNALTHKLHLEMKMRDANTTLARSAAGKDGFKRSDSFDAKMSSANEKISNVLKQLATTKAQEAELRTKLLKHMAGVLSLVLAKREEEENVILHAAVAPPSPPLTASVKSAHHANGSNRSSLDPLDQSMSSMKSRHRFSGAHFFANNASAVQPLSRAAILTSPVSSNFSSPAQKRGIDPNLHAELEQNYRESESALLQSQQDLRHMQKQLEQYQQDRRAERDELDHELARMEDELRDAQAHVAELEAHKSDSENRLVALQDAQRGAADASKELAALRMRMMEADSKLRLAEMDRQRGTELRVQQRQLYDSLQDVLARHREAHLDVLGPDVPPPDSGSVDEFHAYFPQAMDAFFHRLIQHTSKVKQDLDDAHAWQADFQGSFESLQTQLSTVQQDHATTQRQLEQIRGERDQYKQDLDARRQSRAVNKSELNELQRQFHGQSEQLLELARTQQEAEVATKDIRALQADRDALEASVANLQAQLDELNRKELRSNKLLTDAWRILPSTDARAKLGDADDLRAFKAAYSQTSRMPMGNFAVDLASTPSFSPESLADRVGALLHCQGWSYSLGQIRNLVSDDKKLVDRLVKHENTVESQRMQFEWQQRTLQETTAALDAHKQQVRCLIDGHHDKTNAHAALQVDELQERIAVSAKQEVAMLEQLNELQAEHERFRLEKRKADMSKSGSGDRVKELETTNSQLRADMAQLRADLAQTEERLGSQTNGAAPTAELEQTVQALRGDLEDVQAELDETLNREHRLQAEASKLRMELRTEKRKKANV